MALSLSLACRTVTNDNNAQKIFGKPRVKTLDASEVKTENHVMQQEHMNPRTAVKTMGQLCRGQIKSRVGTRCVGARPMNAHVPLSTLFGAAVQRTLIKCQMYTHVNFSGTWPGRKRAEMPCRPGAHASKGLLFGRILMNYENGIW